MKIASRILALLLCLCMLTGCASSVEEIIADKIPNPEYTAVDHEDYAVDFNEIPYERPDVDAMITCTDELIDTIWTYRWASELEEEISEEWLPRYYNYYTMSTVASIHADTDCTDEYWTAEEAFYLENDAEVDALYDRLLEACANSNLAADMTDFFWEGYIEEYADTARTDEAFLALTDRENALIAEYYDIVDNTTLEWDGVERDYNELMNELLETVYAAKTDFAWDRAVDRYYEALEAYYEKYTPILGENYIELIKVRKQIAAYLGYGNYVDYAFEYVWGRDYTPDQADSLCEQIVSELVPLYEETDYSIAQNIYDISASTEELLSVGESFTAAKGGKLAECWEFMQKYSLMDLTCSDTKRDTSYTTYLYDYEMPYILTNSYGDAEDYFTMVHEFGHALDYYVNDGYSDALEIAETFSQGMEMLFLCSLRSGQGLNTADMQRYKLCDALEVFVQQASFHEFESRAFLLSDDELTVDALCEISLDVAEKYGYLEGDMDWYYASTFIDIPHLYEYPFYVISYVVSNEVAMQIYVLETDTEGAGLDAYLELMNRTALPFLEAVEGVEALQSPFRDGALTECAVLLEEGLK